MKNCIPDPLPSRRDFLGRTTALAVSGAALGLPVNQHAADAARKSVPFYVFCAELGVPGMTPRPLPEQAKLFRELGFDGAAYGLWLDDTLPANLEVFDKAGLSLFMFWTSVNVNPAKSPAYDPRVLKAIRQLKGRPVTICVVLSGLPPADPQGMEPAVKALRELGNAAASAGIRISIYNHVDVWAESVPFILEVVKKADHPQVGFNFNVVHWCIVDAQRDWRPLLRENSGKLFCVLLSGYSAAQPRKNLPLDEGTFDQRPLLAALDEIGYRGPVGLMCYGIPGNAREHISRSMRKWRELQATRPAAE